MWMKRRLKCNLAMTLPSHFCIDAFEAATEKVHCYNYVGYIREKLLDQFCDGLRKLGLLRVVRAFPKLFVEMFTYWKRDGG